MSHKPTISHFDAAHGTLKSYTIGFGLSLLLTFAAYFTVTEDQFSRSLGIGIIAALAVLQLIVQLVYFLHLGHESKPRWNLMAFLFMIMVMVIVVFGSIWIMNNLDYQHGESSPSQIEKEIIHDEGIH